MIRSKCLHYGAYGDREWWFNSSFFCFFFVHHLFLFLVMRVIFAFMTYLPRVMSSYIAQMEFIWLDVRLGDCGCCWLMMTSFERIEIACCFYAIVHVHILVYIITIIVAFLHSLFLFLFYSNSSDTSVQVCWIREYTLGLDSGHLPFSDYFQATFLNVIRNSHVWPVNFW